MNEEGDTVKPPPPSYRKPVSCIIGDAYTGKTMLLGCIRGKDNLPHIPSSTTHFPAGDAERRMLVVDNAPIRGSYLCDIAILVVDIMHDHDDGLHPDSLNLLKTTNKQFIVALNKVDMIHDWKTCPNAPFRKALMQQSKGVQDDFHTRVSKVVSQFKTHGLNTDLYYKNNKTIGVGQTFSIVPTSAISGEGIPDMLFLLFKWIQYTIIHNFTYSQQAVQRFIRPPVVKPNDDLDSKSILSRIDTTPEGVCVNACNFYSLEALLKTMKHPQVNIPVSAVNIGPVHKKDVEKVSAMLENKPEYAVVFAFPVMVTSEAWQLAHKLGVKIFISVKMHHLFDRFKQHEQRLRLKGSTQA